jgi:UDP-glucose 4-epimerase
VKVLVTGGTGYVGSAVAALLLTEGHEVTVYDRHEAKAPEGARYVNGDIRDRRTLTAALDGCGAVVHCAASTLVNESYADPASYWRNNLGGTYTLLSAMRRARVPRIVFSSTAAVYGEPESLPVTEDCPARPETPYGASKLACDALLAEHARLHGMAAVSFRYFNVAGAHHYGGKWLGGWRGPQSHLVPNVLLAAARDTAVQVNGTDYPTADGTCIRDYIHVTDLAAAHLAALDAMKLPDGGVHVVVNLGTGTGWSVRQVIQACRDATGKDIAEEAAPRRRGDPVRLVASNTRAVTLLGWAPERDVRQMAGDAWAFMRQEGQA